MGSYITLGIGRMELDLGKNRISRNHSALYLPEDKKDIPYYYSDEEEIVIEMKEGYSRKLSSIKERLDLLGYSIENCKNQYEELISEFKEMWYSIKLSFRTFLKL